MTSEIRDIAHRVIHGGFDQTTYYDALALAEYVLILLPIPTGHDEHAEMSGWDDFFHERRAAYEAGRSGADG